MIVDHCFSYKMRRRQTSSSKFCLHTLDFEILNVCKIIKLFSFVHQETGPKAPESREKYFASILSAQMQSKAALQN